MINTRSMTGKFARNTIKKFNTKFNRKFNTKFNRETKNGILGHL